MKLSRILWTKTNKKTIVSLADAIIDNPRGSGAVAFMNSVRDVPGNRIAFRWGRTANRRADCPLNTHPRAACDRVCGQGGYPRTRSRHISFGDLLASFSQPRGDGLSQLSQTFECWEIAGARQASAAHAC